MEIQFDILWIPTTMNIEEDSDNVHLITRVTNISFSKRKVLRDDDFQKVGKVYITVLASSDESEFLSLLVITLCWLWYLGKNNTCIFIWFYSMYQYIFHSNTCFTTQTCYVLRYIQRSITFLLRVMCYFIYWTTCHLAQWTI